METINEMCIREAKLNKELFDLCESNKGLNGKLHVLFDTPHDEEFNYKVYHADGYCFDVTKEKVHLAEDECNTSAIDGWEYEFSSSWDGFKEIDVEQAIKLF